MRSLAAPLSLVLARLRRRPARWAPALSGLLLATAFACGVAAESVIAGDQGARSVLRAASPLARTVRVSAQGPTTAGLERAARGLLGGLGIRQPVRVVLLGPVRLSGVVVRPAAISPLPAALRGAATKARGGLGRCRATGCPVILAGAERLPATLSAPGVRLEVVARVPLLTPVPLGYAPGEGGGPPVVVTGDVAGLDRLAALGSVYRTQNWLGTLDPAALHSWDLAGVEGRLQRAQVGLPAAGALSLSAPFAVLDTARAEAALAPRRLLLAGGGALAALAVFLVLAGYSLRRERAGDVRRLEAAGALWRHRVLFSTAESGLLAAAGVLGGAALGALVAALLAALSGVPVGATLAHSLLSATGVAAVAGGWLAATVLLSLVLLLPGSRLPDALALAAAAALALALTRGATAGGALAALLAPLACLVGGVVIFRLALAGLRVTERLARDSPPALRLAVIGLARDPAAPALAIAFVAVSVGLAGFALGYRATLARDAADTAADRVPLDALVAPSPSFVTPLQAAPLARWRALAGGPVLAVRRTEATYLSGGASETVPALGVPAAGLPLIHGWRADDGSAALAALARRLRPPGPVRTAGIGLGAGARRLTLSASAGDGTVVLAAVLRDRAGAERVTTLGAAGPRPRRLSIPLAAGERELAALELSAPTGLEATSGHQNAENPAAATQAASSVQLGPVTIQGGRRVTASLAGWRAVGAAEGAHARARRVTMRFSVSAGPGVLRPPQPSDSRPIPLLADPGTAAAAGGGRIALTVDGLPLSGRIVGTLRRFPTLAPGSAGFVVADEATLDAALEAGQPGSGRPDELWIGGPRLSRLRAALARPPLQGLAASYRADVQRSLALDPVARGLLGTLLSAATVAAVLAVLGLLVVMSGALRDRRFERELARLGLGPRAIRGELRLRLMSAAAAGLLAGALLGLGLARLAVAAVQASASLNLAGPPLVTVIPWWSVAGPVALALTAMLLGGALASRGSAR